VTTTRGSTSGQQSP